VEAALDVVNGFRDRPAGSLRLNVPVSAARLILPDIIPGFLAAYPGIRLEVIADENFVDVLAAGCDAGIRYDERLEQDVFGSAYTIGDQPRLSKRAFEIAEMTGARIIRVFSYWRTTDPERCVDQIVAALKDLADRAAERGLIIGLENEQACNAGTGAETGRVLAALDHPALKAIWDPANASILGEIPFPDGYSKVPASRIVHVHAKDCVVSDYKPTWGPLGEMGIDWRGQLAALKRDGYQGAISLETHWRGSDGDRLKASIICGENLRELVAETQNQPA